MVQDTMSGNRGTHIYIISMNKPGYTYQGVSDPTIHIFLRDIYPVLHIFSLQKTMHIRRTYPYYHIGKYPPPGSKSRSSRVVIPRTLRLYTFCVLKNRINVDLTMSVKRDNSPPAYRSMKYLDTH